MAGIKSLEAYHLSRRYFERHAVNLKAQYFIKDRSAASQECTIVNMSRSGLALSMHEEARKDEIIFLETIAPRGAERITIQGHVVRFDKNNMICGVKFDKALDNTTMDKLLDHQI